MSVPHPIADHFQLRQQIFIRDTWNNQRIASLNVGLSHKVKDFSGRYRFAVVRVPEVHTARPRQLIGEGGEEETQRPRDDYVVIEVHVEGNQDDRVSDSCRNFKMRKSSVLTLFYKNVNC